MRRQCRSCQVSPHLRETLILIGVASLRVFHTALTALWWLKEKGYVMRWLLALLGPSPSHLRRTPGFPAMSAAPFPFDCRQCRSTYV
ncbi:hypothetical protein TSMEX_010481 [Taenia solium]|eukprot:TsM_000255300 transcript=TsM_000255300 gene=TsM_000255300